AQARTLVLRLAAQTLLLADAVEALVRPQKQLPLDDRRTAVEGAVVRQGVVRQLLEFRADSQDVGPVLLAHHVNLAIGDSDRRVHATLEALRVHLFAVLGL